MSPHTSASNDPTSAPNPAATAAVMTGLREFLAFKLGAEEYGIDILRVQEIRSYEEPTHIANSAAFVKGVVNLRGIIVPVVDLRLKFDLERADFDGFTVIIVLNIDARIIGIVADSVSDVITLAAEQLRPMPELSSIVDSDHLLGIGALDDRMLILMDIEKLVTSLYLGPVNE